MKDMMPESPVLGWPRQHCEATDHVSVDDVIIFAAPSVFALPREDFEVVSVIRPALDFLLLSEVRAVTFLLGKGNERTEGALAP